MMLYRKNDAVLDFDFVKVKEQSRDNPVFYVQYGHARGFSIFRNAREGVSDDSPVFPNLPCSPKHRSIASTTLAN
jgi:arginyl-tRNA synthetase